MEGIFEALGDGSRRSILELLGSGEQQAGALVAALQSRAVISQPAVSQHLKVLRDAGLVTVRAEGTRRFYSIDAAGVAAAQAWLAHLADPLAAFEQPMDALATEVARGQRATRSGPAMQRSGRVSDSGQSTSSTSSVGEADPRRSA